MMILLFLAVAIAVPTVVGFVRSRRKRGVTGVHRVAFVGFSAGVVAVTALITGTGILCWLGPVRSKDMGAALQNVTAVSSIIQHLSTLTAFVCGFFTAGVWRVFLIVFGPLMFFMYVN